MARSQSFTPPAAVAACAEEGLRLRRQHGRGGTRIGVARARDLKNRRPVSAETIARMVRYFARHAVDKQAPGFSDQAHPSAGRIAWLLWGGDPGYIWSHQIKAALEAESRDATPHSATPHSATPHSREAAMAKSDDDQARTADMSQTRFAKGQEVAWPWGGNTATGTVKERFEQDVQRTLKGTRVKRKASSQEPAYPLEQADGDRVLKSGSELRPVSGKAQTGGDGAGSGGGKSGGATGGGGKSARRGGDGALADKTKAELYALAKDRDLPGRSTMDKGQLIQALGRHEPLDLAPTRAAAATGSARPSSARPVSGTPRPWGGGHGRDRSRRLWARPTPIARTAGLARPGAQDRPTPLRGTHSRVTAPERAPTSPQRKPGQDRPAPRLGRRGHGDQGGEHLLAAGRRRPRRKTQLRHRIQNGRRRPRRIDQADPIGHRHHELRLGGGGPTGGRHHQAQPHLHRATSGHRPAAAGGRLQPRLHARPGSLGWGGPVALASDKADDRAGGGRLCPRCGRAQQAADERRAQHEEDPQHGPIPGSPPPSCPGPPGLTGADAEGSPWGPGPAAVRRRRWRPVPAPLWSRSAPPRLGSGTGWRQGAAVAGMMPPRARVGQSATRASSAPDIAAPAGARGRQSFPTPERRRWSRPPGMRAAVTRGMTRTDWPCGQRAREGAFGLQSPEPWRGPVGRVTRGRAPGDPRPARAG